MTAQPCTWCGVSFTPRTTGGKPQRFCSERCRRQFDSGCRAWAEQAVASGLLTVSALKDALTQRARFVEADLAQAPELDTSQAARAQGVLSGNASRDDTKAPRASLAGGAL